MVYRYSITLGNAGDSFNKFSFVSLSEAKECVRFLAKYADLEGLAIKRWYKSDSYDRVYSYRDGFFYMAKVPLLTLQEVY